MNTAVLLAQGCSRMRCLVDKPVRPGQQLTLKGVDGWWKVIETGATPVSDAYVHRDWHNNI